MTVLLDPIVGDWIVLCIALLFLVAGVHKLRDLAAFSAALAGYEILPAGFAARMSWLVPCVELAAALLMVWEPGRRIGILGAMMLLLAYGVAIAANIARGRRDVHCGCGAGYGFRRIAPWMVWRNGLLAAALGAALVPRSDRVLGTTDFLTLAGGLAACVLLYAAFDRLLGDVAPRAAALRGAR